MKTETNKLAHLVQLALQNSAVIPVTATEILGAVTGLETAVHLLPYSNTDHFTARNNLIYASGVLANLIFNLNSGVLSLPRTNRQYLAARTRSLCKKIDIYLESFTPGKFSVLCRGNLIPVPSLIKVLALIAGTLKIPFFESDSSRIILEQIAVLQKTRFLSYHRWRWWSHFSAAFLNKNTTADQSLERLLLALNFNDPAFIACLSAKLSEELDALITVQDKLRYLTAEIIKYNVIYPESIAWMPAERSVNQTMLLILKTHRAVWQYAPREIPLTSKPPASKINTALSVPQLALLVRLLVDTKIINTANATELLKNIATVMYTANAAAVSPESLRVKYYTPNPAAKNILKDYLINMVNLLRNY